MDMSRVVFVSTSGNATAIVGNVFTIDANEGRKALGTLWEGTGYFAAWPELDSESGGVKFETRDEAVAWLMGVRFGCTNSPSF